MKSFFEEEKGGKNTPFFMRRSIGRDYRKEIEQKMKSAESIDDLRFIVTNFDSSLVKLAFIRALAKAEKVPRMVKLILPKEMKKKNGGIYKFEEEEEIVVDLDVVSCIKEDVLTYARVEIPRAVHRCVDVSELAFFLGE